MITHAIINGLLAGLVPLENYLVQQKIRKTHVGVLLLLSLIAYPCFISGELIYMRRRMGRRKARRREGGGMKEEEEDNNDDEEDDDNNT